MTGLSFEVELDLTGGITRETYAVEEPTEVLDTAAGPAIVLRLVGSERP